MVDVTILRAIAVFVTATIAVHLIWKGLRALWKRII